MKYVFFFFFSVDFPLNKSISPAKPIHWDIDRNSYGPLPVLSTYNAIYRMYNPIYNQL